MKVNNVFFSSGKYYKEDQYGFLEFDMEEINDISIFEEGRPLLLTIDDKKIKGEIIKNEYCLLNGITYLYQIAFVEVTK